MAPVVGPPQTDRQGGHHADHLHPLHAQGHRAAGALVHHLPFPAHSGHTHQGHHSRRAAGKLSGGPHQGRRGECAFHLRQVQQGRSRPHPLRQVRRCDWHRGEGGQRRQVSHRGDRLPRFRPVEDQGGGPHAPRRWRRGIKNQSQKHPDNAVE